MAHKKSPAQLDREIDEALASQSGLSRHHRYLLSRRKPGGGLRAGYLTPAGWHGDPLAIEDPKLRLEALREQPAPRLPKGRHATKKIPTAEDLSSRQRALLRDLRRAKLYRHPLSVEISKEDVARQLADLGLLHIEPDDDLGLTWVTVTGLGREVAIKGGLWGRK